MTPQPPSQFLENKLQELIKMGNACYWDWTGYGEEKLEKFLTQYHSELIQEILQVGEGMKNLHKKETYGMDATQVLKEQTITEYQSKIKSL